MCTHSYVASDFPTKIFAKTAMLSKRKKAAALCISCCLVVYLLVDVNHPWRGSTRYSIVGPLCGCQSADTWSRSIPVGRMQLEQYRRLSNLTKRGGFVRTTRDHTKYTYNITVLEATRQCSDVRVRLDEYYDGKRTVGGSGFLALTDSPTEREVCSYTDYFNGTYTIWCPAPPTTCAELTIRHQYVDFVAYYRSAAPQEQVVLRRSVCPFSNTAGCTTRGHANSPATWLRGGTSWTVGYVRGEPVSTLLDASEICECIRTRFDRILLVGASHMRYKFDYLMPQSHSDLTKIERKHKALSIGRIHFNNKMFGDSFSPVFEKVQHKINLKRKSLVFFQTGAHDITGRGFSKAMGHLIDAYVTAVVDAKQRADKVGFKFVVLSTPPYPDHDRVGLRGLRNNYALAALSRLLQEKLSPYNINFFDEFGVILPQQNNDTRRCGSHYLCRVPGEGIHGYVGITAFRMLMTDVCTH